MVATWCAKLQHVEHDIQLGFGLCNLLGRRDVSRSLFQILTIPKTANMTSMTRNRLQDDLDRGINSSLDILRG